MKLKEKVRPLIDFYQKQMWHFEIAVGQVRKPLQFVNEALLILTFLAVKGWEVGVGTTVTVYAGALIGFVILGKIFIKLGIVQYLNTLGNEQNPEIMEIKKNSRYILNKLDEIDKKL